MTSKWNDAVLDRFAAHVSHDIRMCTAMLEELVEDHGNEVPPSPQGFMAHGGVSKDALLYCSLMYLRSLDDFFGSKGQRSGLTHDIQAKDWLPGRWPAEFWLDPLVRAQIEWRVLHLSAVRDLSGEDPPWRPADYGAALCDEADRFFTEIQKSCPDRLPAFTYDPWGDVLRRKALFAQHASVV